MHYLHVAIAALIPMVIGFIWYNPNVLGNVWMKASGMTDEKIKGGNMGLIFGLSFVFAVLLSMGLVHLTHDLETFMDGLQLGAMAGVFVALPILATNSLFERKGFDYILVNSGYWILTMALMTGYLVQFA